MDLKKAIKEIIKNEKNFSFLNELIHEHQLSEKDSKALKYYAKNKLKSILDIAKMGDEFDAKETLTLLVNVWFEWRSEWIRCNAVNNYNMVFFGNADVLCVLKSSYISYLISKIEPLIPQDTLQKIHNIMVEIQYQV